MYVYVFVCTVCMYETIPSMHQDLSACMYAKQIEEFQGRIVQGQRHGAGKLKYASSSSCFIIQYVMHSYKNIYLCAFFRYRNGDEVTGSFSNGCIEGQGEIKYANKDLYKGDFSRGVKHGQGLYTYRCYIQYILKILYRAIKTKNNLFRK